MSKNDLWIASTAFIFDAKLITTDKDFTHLDAIFTNVETIATP
jgi:predicted nucleic acid-binding protein